MPEVVAAHRSGRQHGKAFGQGDARALLGLEQIEEDALLGVIWTGGVARRGPDSLETLLDEPLIVQCLVRCVTPELLAYPLVQPLREGLGQPIGQRLGQNGAVVIMLSLEPRNQGVYPLSGGYRKGPDIVVQSGVSRRHEIC